MRGRFQHLIAWGRGFRGHLTAAHQRGCRRAVFTPGSRKPRQADRAAGHFRQHGASISAQTHFIEG